MFPGNIRPIASVGARATLGSPHISLDFIFETAVRFEEKPRGTPGLSTKKGGKIKEKKDATM
ncbi:MAG: hypothetical protein WC029_03250 [Sulfuricella sp.]